MAQKGHLGPGPPNVKGWSQDGGYGWGAQNPLGDKGTPPGPKTKIEAWGLGMWKLARKANDGRIWLEAKNDDCSHERPGEGAMAKGP
ncbi:hypothetical protein O181_029737 [Austropuccinia psidii MF-1]|uniref:Uncharacterized protein n=1 Tax=Austropuccinia psidii MF-1 TaxID=1389203 RepID=A0A9Q3CX68_9BASI|nr:hypothetical protein [Austropuccinia psidii MF-1]